MIIDCRRSSELLSQQQDRRLRIGERLSLWLHLMICDPCVIFRQNLAVMRSILGRIDDREEKDDETSPVLPDEVLREMQRRLDDEVQG